MSSEPGERPLLDVPFRRAKQLAIGIIHARAYEAGDQELTNLEERAIAEVAGAGAGDDAGAYLMQAFVTVGADLLLLACTAAGKSPDNLVTELQDVYQGK